MSNIQWKKEIEKKYVITDGTQFETYRKKALHNGLVPLFYALQRDWVPDFENSEMKKKGVLLRIRHTTLKKGNFPRWIVTLKKKHIHNGIHDNLELEASSETEGRLVFLEQEIENVFNKKIDLRKVADLNSEYIEKIGLTTHRMLLEKYREEFTDSEDKILLSFDELPSPLGYFIELESNSKILLNNWEQKLGLALLPSAQIDYGEMVKNLDGGKQRVLVFK